MSFISHTKQDVDAMLETIGVSTIDALFDEIPSHLQIPELDSTVPEALNEMSLMRTMQARAEKDARGLCFIGAGAYEHHIPAAVWEIASRGEFMTAYTPYQAEASQGTLQLIYEYQTMMASLTGMDVSNASLYDGASALAEAVMMAVRCNPKNNARTVLIPQTAHPHYRQVLQTTLRHQNIQCHALPYDAHTGRTTWNVNELPSDDNIAAMVISQPNFWGVLEEVDALTDWAHTRSILVVAVVNPIWLAIGKEPGTWGKKGADIACGEGQPFGVPLASGGPYIGFITCKKDLVRQLPGRIVGRTIDKHGMPGFTLTLQAREQHIRRAKATSNICTNQGLLATASTIYMALMGVEGLRRVAAASHANTRLLLEKVLSIPGVTRLFSSPFFHEIVLKLPETISVDNLLTKMLKHGIQGGLDLSPYYPELGNAILVCVTETKTAEDIENYVRALRQSCGHLLTT